MMEISNLFAKIQRVMEETRGEERLVAVTSKVINSCFGPAPWPFTNYLPRRNGGLGEFERMCQKRGWHVSFNVDRDLYEIRSGE